LSIRQKTIKGFKNERWQGFKTLPTLAKNYFISMKILTKILAIIALVVISLPSKAGDEPQIVKIKTSAICEMCKKTIERNLAYEKGVKEATLDLKTKEVTVVYLPKKTTIEKIKKNINDSGYDADEKPSNPKSYSQLEDCCKKDSNMH
jgi:periplasmic mercuric ion binding protein